MKRTSPVVILTNYRRVLSSLPIMLIGAFWLVRKEPSTSRTVMIIGFLIYVVIVLAGPVLEWLQLRYGADADGITISTGLFSRKDVRYSWDTISRVQTSDNMIGKKLGFTNLELGANTEDNKPILLEMVSLGEAERIMALHRVVIADQAGVEEADSPVELMPSVDGPDDGGGTDALAMRTVPTQVVQNPIATAPEAGMQLIHLSTPRDIAVASLVGGRAFLIIPAFFFILDKIGDYTKLNINLTQLGLAIFGEFSPLAIAAIVGTFLLLAIAYGAVTAWLSNGRLQVFAGDDSFLVRAGVWNRRTVHLKKINVVGFRIQSNPIAKIFSYAKLEVLSNEAGDSEAHVLVIPMAARTRINTLLDAHFDCHIDDIAVHTSARITKIYIFLTSALVVTAAIVGGWLLNRMWGWWAVGFVALIFVVVLLSFYGALGYDTGRRVVLLREGLLSRTDHILTYDRVHSAEYRHGPLDKQWGLAKLHVRLYEGESNVIDMGGIPRRVVLDFIQEVTITRKKSAVRRYLSAHL